MGFSWVRCSNGDEVHPTRVARWEQRRLCDPRYGSDDPEEIGRRNGDFGGVRPMDCIDLDVVHWVSGIFGVLELCSWVVKVVKFTEIVSLTEFRLLSFFIGNGYAS
ncbi:hypothetical protein OPV22_017942 [Ensete ventricosum]|uniref:Uncharacterized protein n=1 Tax=Ensete ventricosum TaxID=4639 RepID=A0AAV8R252_ENSVE|nr:hypothetical protein OPV22_017942 [Ensete ventricosum]